MQKIVPYIDIQFANRTYDPLDHIRRIGLQPEPHLIFQAQCYVKAQVLVNACRPERYQRTDMRRESLKQCFEILGLYGSRDLRCIECKSQDVLDATNIKIHLMKGLTFFCNCGDGRCLTKNMWGFHGQTLRYPAGESKEFRWDSRQKRIYLPEDSELARALHETVAKLRALGLNDLVEVLDSHIHCAARKREEEDRYGRQLYDDGLYYDLVKKIEIAGALKQFIANAYGDSISPVVFHTSFNPETGYAYMGLELHLEEAWIKQEGFTESVINRLVADGSIISTEELVRHREVRDEFDRYAFDLNYEFEYVQSTIEFWHAIQAMMLTAHSYIANKVRALYPSESDLNIRRRALLLMTNAFTRYLFTKRFGDAYPYSDHTESSIMKTLSEKGPHRVMHAASLDPTNPHPSTALKFFTDLIRDNRRHGRMSDPEKDMVAQNYGGYDEYVQESVISSTFRRVKDMSLPALPHIREVDWSDLALAPWQKWNEQDLEEYVLRKLSGRIGFVSTETMRAISGLHEKAKEIYRYGLPATEPLLEGKIVNIPTLAGPNRETIAFFPFISAEAS